MKVAREIFDNTAEVTEFHDGSPNGASFFCGCMEGDMADCFPRARDLMIKAIATTLDLAVRKERESCAEVAESAIDNHTFNDKTFQNNDTAEWIAKAIRQRGEGVSHDTIS